MGTLLDKPITEKETHSDAANGYRYGVSAMQGWRVEMEDAHIAIGSIEGLEDHGFFAVFDGHGGQEALGHAHADAAEGGDERRALPLAIAVDLARGRLPVDGAHHARAALLEHVLE